MARKAGPPAPMPFHHYRPFTPDPAAGSHVAVPGDHPGAALVQRGPARRQPGPDRSDGPGAQAAHVRPAGAVRLQGDRGGLPGRLPARLRLRPPAHRGGPDPGRRDHPGPHPGPARADRAHLRVAARRPAGDGPPLQLHLHPPAPGRLRPGPGRHRGHRGARGPALPRADRHHPRVRRALPVLARELHRHRARLRGGDLRGGDGRVGADARPGR